MPLWRAQAPKPVVPPSPPGGGDVYGAYIKSLLDYELARQSGLEARASTVVTTAGALVTLLFGLVAVITGAARFRLPGAAHGWLIAAVLLVVAGIGPAAAAASEHVAEAQLKLITIARRKNSRIAWIVLLSGIAELLALVMLAVAVILILR